MIEFTCACGQKHKVKDEYAEKKGRCKNCGASLQIPVAETGNEGRCAKIQLNDAAPSGDRQFAEELAKKSYENETEENERERTNEELRKHIPGTQYLFLLCNNIIHILQEGSTAEFCCRHALRNGVALELLPGSWLLFLREPQRPLRFRFFCFGRQCTSFFRFVKII